ncbi:transporter [Candidatus Moduliflexus flocculans]|uniref:Transporter n=1 Tax=Candidatus Moduliflexus flocculans TaxID=1499966 RepID=A0A081BTE6_9BACT|nr:transporter [Candidatus Moduliflexus flocculans]
MQNFSIEFANLLSNTIFAIITSLSHNWIPLSFAILTAALMTVYMDAEKLKRALIRNTNASIWGSVALGAFTPLCACGTMAVILGMLTTTLPWGPIMAFLTSSPLMSPDGFIMLAGLLNMNFAIALTLASVAIGLGSGYLTHVIEKKTSFLHNQTRFSNPNPSTAPTCGCSGTVPVAQTAQTCGCSGNLRPQPVQACGCADVNALPRPDWNNAELCCAVANDSSFTQAVSMSETLFMPFGAFYRLMNAIKWREIGDAIVKIGFKQILLYYSIFVAVGFLINSFVPTSLIVALFNADNLFAVPLAALVGLPLYVTTESSIPLIQALMKQGASEGAMLAFMITGPGTSAWVIAGIVTIMKKRAIGLYVLFLLFGGIAAGYLYDLFLRVY